MGTPRERGSGTSHSPVPPRNHDHYSTMLCCSAYFIITLLKEVHCPNISSTTMNWFAFICSCSNLMLITQLKAS